MSVTHWIFRIGDGVHFWNSSKHNIWGVKGTSNIQKGDIIWFVTGNSDGHLVAVATYTHSIKRSDNTLSNKELGWVEQEGNWDNEIHYKNLYDIRHLKYKSHIKGSSSRRRYNINCKINLPIEYPLIVKYSRVIKIE